MAPHEFGMEIVNEWMSDFVRCSECSANADRVEMPILFIVYFAFHLFYSTSRRKQAQICIRVIEFVGCDKPHSRIEVVQTALVVFD